MDLHNDVKYSRAISPASVTNANTAFVSQILDTSGFESNEVIIAYGTMSDADSTVTALLEDGDDSALSDNAAVADGYLQGTEAACSTLAAAGDDTVVKLGYLGTKRYIRLTLTPAANNAGTITLGAVWAQSGKKKPQT